MNGQVVLSAGRDFVPGTLYLNGSLSNVCGSWSPLVPALDAFNPCFLGVLLVSISLLSAIFCAVQLAELAGRQSYGDWKIRDIHHWIRISGVTFETVLFFLLATQAYTGDILDVRFLAFLSATGLLLLFALPLHLLEPTRAIGPRASLLFLWPVLSLFQAVVFVQHLVTDWKLIPDDGTSTIAIIIGLSSVNAASVTILESCFWAPTRQLVDHYTTNGLELDVPNLYSRLSLTYMNEMIQVGYVNQTLDEDDIPDAPYHISAEYTTDIFEKVWQKQAAKKSPSVLIALLEVFGLPLIQATAIDVLATSSRYAQPFLLRSLIQFFSSEEQTLLVGFLIAAGMFSVSMLQIVLNNESLLKTWILTLGARSALSSIVYNKALKLSTEAKLEASTGDIVNLLSVDIRRIQNMSSDLQVLISSPVDLVLCLVSLYYLLGNATFGGLVIMLFMFPINSVLVKTLRSLYKTQMKYKDLRTKITNEILMSVKSIKLYAWEKPMLKKLFVARNDQELANMKKIGVFRAGVGFAWSSIPFMVSSTTFAIFASTGDHPLNSEIAFPALALFNLLGEPIANIPWVINSFVETFVSIGRLTKFLLLSELDEELVSRLPPAEHLNEVAVEVSNATFYYGKAKSETENYDEEQEVATSKVALKNVNFIARKGELSCIVGRVGSGKSTFLQAILGQLVCEPADKTTEPSITISGGVAYCSQVPFILNASVKDNILFGCRYEEEFYEKTIKACELVTDLEVLPDGDETQVGEKGISLSGGQKARLSLARAVYARADIYIFDDILSAVDAHVGENLIKNVLGPNGILASKTRILATNSVPVLQHSSNIVLLVAGEITERGTYSDVRAPGTALHALIEEFGAEDLPAGSETMTACPSTSGSENTSDSESIIDYDATHRINEYTGLPRINSGLEDENDMDIDLESDLYPLKRNLTHATLRRASMETLRRKPLLKRRDNRDPEAIDIEDEENALPAVRTAQNSEKSEKGRVKWSVYMAYARACSYSGIALVIFMCIAGVILSVASNYWLKHWAEKNDESGSNDNVFTFVAIYALFGIGGCLVSVLRNVVMLMFCSIRGSKVIHDTMAEAILRAPMSFFETTPLGRIMNRFSTDINGVDEGLPNVFSTFLVSIIRTIFILGVVGYAMPSFLVIVFFLSFAYIYYQQYYMVVSRELKRILSITRSPIYAHLQETIIGVDTIRAYGQAGRFKFFNTAALDFNLKSVWAFRSTNRWLTTRLQVIGSVIIFSSSALALLSLKTSSPLTSGMVGLAMSYALQVTDNLRATVRITVDVETNIVSVERCLEYCELKSEAAPIIEGKRPTADWPAEGAVKFDHYSARYRENLDLVLDDINLDIKPTEKIGIVGRTGAGKSSLALAIFRLIEPAAGGVEIDGMNTSDIGLYDLRHKLSIIPQDSQAFEGTIRQNLDPLEEHSDEALWSVLKLAHLEGHIASMGDGLMSAVSESGANLSVGQRQLMCLARALLNPSKVLVLDEATAAVDVQTDKIIQQTIREEFKDRTILTIAHRLDTVIDCDRIVVLDRGKVKEFDSPKNLLSDKETIFYSLCDQGGYLKNIDL